MGPIYDYSQMANQLLTLAAMGDDPRRMKGINPLNQTEGGFFPTGGGAMGAVRGGRSMTPERMLEGAAQQVRAAQGDIGLAKAIQFAARRWEVDPKALTEFLKKR